MHHHLSGPFWGNVIIIALAGAITRGLLRGNVPDAVSSGRDRPTPPQVRHFA